jgi:holo-[acyl-carrier protein] synthase
MDLMDFISIGVDIVHIERISKNIDDVNDRFINRVYTEDEIKYCKSRKNFSHHFAGRLAGKEAVSKALKLSWEEGLNWKDIEIINEENGIPRVVLHGKIKKIGHERKIRNIKISISHEKEYAVAFAVTSRSMGNE